MSYTDPQANMKIVITEIMDSEAVSWLRKQFNVLYDPLLVDQQQAMVDVLSDADAVIIKERTQINSELLNVTPRLKVVGRLGVGLDNIELPACRARNIEVIPAVGANAYSVAEYVMCAALILSRPHVYLCSHDVAAGRWPQKIARNGHELSGKILGILGLGSIGQRVACLARAFDMKLLAWAPTKPGNSPVFQELGVSPTMLDDLLARADVVSIHVPLNDSTRNLLNRSRIFSMKQGAILINTSRGGIVDENALVDTLKSSNGLSGAAIDVFEHEPLAANSVLAGVPNVLLSPHVAGGTVESTKRRGMMIAQKVAAFLSSM